MRIEVTYTGLDEVYRIFNTVGTLASTLENIATMQEAFNADGRIFIFDLYITHRYNQAVIYVVNQDDADRFIECVDDSMHNPTIGHEVTEPLTY
jgi:hypothetical protein|tara:strand:- start:459 stop:740 length:282 start_codon:yes stop_codon:yes gene_type:complete